MRTANRRIMLKGAAMLAAMPAATAIAQAQSITPIARLWAQVEACNTVLASHAAAIAEAETLRGVSSGWMYLSGAAHAAGQTRYEALTGILKEAARDSADLALQARASLHTDMANGPRAWAGERLAHSVLSFSATA